MDRFLNQCAQYILQKHSHEMEDICLVFPNRRSGVFFSAYLRQLITNPVIGPEITTINELISGYSPYYQADKLLLISELYGVFKNHTGTSESFDEFFFWGEILLNDFQDIDRYLVNAKDLFRYISDIKTIDSLFDYLSAEQKEAIQQFWGSLAKPSGKEFEKKYISVWEKLYPVYTDFRKLLEVKKLAYGGMSDRWVAEHLNDENIIFPFKIYYFIGHNVLNACENSILVHLLKERKAAFLWDYDDLYVKNPKHEAGRFMRENLKKFPPPADFERGLADVQPEKTIVLAAVPSLQGQAQAIPVFLKKNMADVTPGFDNTAIVLADESLLYPALGAIPDSFAGVNVTMGYPVKNSVVYGFLMLLASLLKNSKKDKDKETVVYHRYITNLLNHQLVSGMDDQRTKEYLATIRKKNRIVIPLSEIDFTPFHRMVFDIPDSVGLYSEYFIRVLEALHHWVIREDPENRILPELITSVLSALERMRHVIAGVIDGNKQAISHTVYFSLLNQYLGQINVAFEGEPLSGMQVMGILETRCIDFENVIILGFNENKWPRTTTAPSFIPHNLRKGFGLPGIDQQDAMYAYYFYRLIQRAKNVSATYNVSKEGVHTGELSRYGFQLLYGSSLDVKKVNIDFYFLNDPVRPLSFQSSPEKVNDLLSRITEEHPLSPSALNLWFYCRLRFYFRYFLQLPEPDEVKEEIDSQLFGNIFHETVENLYKRFTGKNVQQKDLKKMAADTGLLESEILKAMANNFFMEHDAAGKIEVPQGKNRLIFENIKTFVKQLLKVEADYAPFTLISLEQVYKTRLEILLNEKPVNVWIGGKIDRIDLVGDTMRIIDYKTGSVTSRVFSEIQDIFPEDGKNHKKEILQAMTYTWIISRNFTGQKKLQPVIYGLKDLFRENFSPEIRMKDESFSFFELEDGFLYHLGNMVATILSPDTLFYQTNSEDKCQYCPYRKICQRAGKTN